MRRRGFWLGGVALVVASMTLGCGGEEVEVGKTSSKQTAAQAHATITNYTGPEVCVACHMTEAVNMHGSVHYQMEGAAPAVTNITVDSGKMGNAAAVGINTYCGAVVSSPAGLCRKCHVSNGRLPLKTLPSTQPEKNTELANIDCMVCHQTKYKRKYANPYTFPILTPAGMDQQYLTLPVEDPTGFDFTPDGAKILVNYGSPAGWSEQDAINQAAKDVHLPNRNTCLSCHAVGGGGNGKKRGDINMQLATADASHDIHMNATGENMVCADCHAANNHRIKGRGIDLRPSDVVAKPTCKSCHGAAPHSDLGMQGHRSKDRHAQRVACQSCHIPTYGKVSGTELTRDWEHPHWDEMGCAGQGCWEPTLTWGTNVVPEYVFFDGTSDVYYLGMPAFDFADGLFKFAMPNGSVAGSSSAKLYPMKVHTTRARMYSNPGHAKDGAVIPQSSGKYFGSSNLQLATEIGMMKAGMPGTYAANAVAVDLHTYQMINHGVQSKQTSLSCDSCHHRNQTRIDFDKLGYGLAVPTRDLCKDCHTKKDLTGGFMGHHDIHVGTEGLDCSHCHSFTRPERNLSMP